MDNPEVVPVAQPAAGAEWIYTADDDVVVHAMRFRLVADATVASRRVKLTCEDASGNIYFHDGCTADTTASQTNAYGASAGRATGSANNNLIPIPLPAQGLPMKAGCKPKSATDFKAAGDQFSQIVLVIERIGRPVA